MIDTNTKSGNGTSGTFCSTFCNLLISLMKSVFHDKVLIIMDEHFCIHTIRKHQLPGCEISQHGTYQLVRILLGQNKLASRDHISGKLSYHTKKRRSVENFQITYLGILSGRFQTDILADQLANGYQTDCLTGRGLPGCLQTSWPTRQYPWNRLRASNRFVLDGVFP